ncbi:hypothetical protein D6C90_00376 [Aureobasidium pullulans]|uniref:Uncharacterized protein n=1 Tax=Aureobasidium pullulans TaxID=5580 RepID=A0A4S9VNE3_AURPU|nr:hypothetical protein D6C90_00376 [Aureobasidium pullulans]
MAGNPFRKSQFLSLDVGAAREAAAADLRLDTSQPATTATNTQTKPKGKVQKKVRILSPVVSPDTPAAHQEHDPFNSYLNPVGQSASIPPTTEDQDIDVARELRKSFIESLARGASKPNTELTGAAAPIAPPIAPAPAPAPSTYPASVPSPLPEKMENPFQPGQAPYNPFAKTLATIDPQNASSAPVGLSRDASAPSAKPAMDVDAFTRMLLTGNTPSASPGPLTPSSRLPSGRTNSLGDLHPESPSASDDEHHDDPPDQDYEQLTGLVKTPEAHSKKQKPPPPAHHHGKALPPTRKGPQTVSFADFDVPATPPALPSPSLASPKPQLMRSPSDLNKPLPPPPPPHQSPSPEVAPPITLDQADGPAQSPQLPAEDFYLQSKKAPPPPLSRRSSQLRSGSGRPRSSSNLSRSSVPDDYSDGTATPPSKPPPPPARRVPHSVETDLPPPSARPPLPPPPRNAKQRPPSVSRTPSTTSVGSINSRTQQPAMPPPPPPRRGENKRRSLDGTMLGISAPSSRRMSDTSRRSSGASFSGRTSSVSSIPTVDEGDSGGEDRSFNATPQPEMQSAAAASGGGPDILADMSAMQAEIDALMARSKGT